MMTKVRRFEVTLKSHPETYSTKTGLEKYKMAYEHGVTIQSILISMCLFCDLISAKSFCMVFEVSFTPRKHQSTVLLSFCLFLALISFLPIMNHHFFACLSLPVMKYFFLDGFPAVYILLCLHSSHQIIVCLHSPQSRKSLLKSNKNEV